MPSVLSKVSSHVTTKSTAVVSVAILSLYLINLRNKHRASMSVKDLHIKLSDALKKEEKAAVDMKFFQRLFSLLKVIIPGFFSAESGYLTLVAFLLVARTYCDVWMIGNGTAIESVIIGRNKELFKHHLFKFLYAMPTFALINNLLKMGLSELKLRFRTRLTHHLYDKYMKGFTYYQMSNLDSRITNVDQLLTQDVEKFCDCVAELYSNLSKPVLDIFIYAIKLASAIGAQGPGYMVLYLLFSGFLLTRIRRPLGQMTMKEQQYEGEFRFVNSRLIANSEEVAFYRGNAKELSILHNTFTKLVDHLRDLISFKFKTGIVDSLIAKYIATTVGYLVVSRPFLDLGNPRLLSSTHSQRLEYYYESGRMLISMAQAIGRVVLSGREMSRLAGYTARIIQLQQVLHDLHRGRYVRTMLENSNQQHAPGELGTGSNGESEFEVIPKRHATNLVPGSGKVIQMDHVIKFENVPLVTPNGDVLVEELNFEVKAGTNVIIVGPNGCGKSSLFRILGGLWPVFGGVLTKPAPTKLFYIPQRPYMALGTLRDQLIYPDTPPFMRMKNVSDADLASYLEKVQLSYILDREGGWDSVQDWGDVLSGGEKQRIAMARLFYHKPQFAILDECTSAVSVDVEGAMYRYCRQMGITLFTVSHRKSLWQHHEYFLHMDGRGGFEFKPITETTEQFGS